MGRVKILLSKCLTFVSFSKCIPFEKDDDFQQRIFLVAYCSSSWDFEPKKQYLQNMGKSLHTREFEILKVVEHSTSRTGDI